MDDQIIHLASQPLKSAIVADDRVLEFEAFFEREKERLFQALCLVILQFLTQRRAGFCVHYSSATAVMVRSTASSNPRHRVTVLEGQQFVRSVFMMVTPPAPRQAQQRRRGAIELRNALRGGQGLREGEAASLRQSPRWCATRITSPPRLPDCRRTPR